VPVHPVHPVLPTRVATLLVLTALVLAGCVTPTTPGPLHFAGLKFETRLGSFTAILFENETPASAAFMQKLVDAHYYDGRAFGRIIPGFVIQEVDRTGGTTDQKEHVRLEAPRNVSFSAGAFGIARDADPDSGGSEFFIMDFATSSLYGNYTAFAQVVGGLDVVHAIARERAVNTGPASSVVGAPPGSPVYFGLHDRVPVDPVVMTRVTRVDVALAPSIAARYPLQVGPSVTTASMRATLEWPHDLNNAHSSDLTWYVAPRGGNGVQDPPLPDLAGAFISVTGPANVTIMPTEDAKAPGILRWSWTPSGRGDYTLRLTNASGELAATVLSVS